MLTKEKIQKTIRSLPENPDLELVIEKLILLDKIDKGVKDADNGEVYSGEQVRDELKKWLK